MRQIYATKREHLELFCRDLLEMQIPEFGIHIEIKTGQRTTKQNSAIHKYFSILADTLNDAGLDKRSVFKFFRDGIDVPWTPTSTKEDLWLPIMEAQTGKTSTTKLKRKEVSQVYETLTRFLTGRLGVSVPFPSNDPPMI